MGDQALNFIFWRKLTDQGLFVSPFTKPAVERDCVRAVFMATHTDAQIDRALEIFQDCGRQVGIIPHERPHTRVEVKVARPGATGFVSSAETGRAPALRREEGRLQLATVLGNRAEPLQRRLFDAAEVLTWRALNLGPDDVLELVRYPEKLWTQRHRIRNRLLSKGMDWMANRQTHRPSGAARATGGDEANAPRAEE